MKRMTILAIACMLLVGPIGAAWCQEGNTWQEISDGNEIEVISVGDLVERLARRDPQADPSHEELVGQTERLAEVIRSFIAPTLEGNEDIKALGAGVVVASARPESRAWIRSFLDRHRREPRDIMMISIETTFIFADPDALDRLGIGPKPSILESEEDRAALFDEIRAGSGIQVVTSPRLMLMDFSNATIRIGDRLHYIKEYRVFERVEPGAKTLEVPVIGTIDAGVSFEGLAATLDDSTIGLEFKLRFSEVVRPVATRMTEYGEVAVPEVTTMEVESKVAVRDGATLVFPAPEHLGRHPILLIRCNRLTRDQFEDQW